MTATVVVTGASRGVGSATARWLGRAGCRVICVARDEEALQETAASVTAEGGHAVVVPGDVRATATVDAITAAAGSGALAALVNNAAIIEPIERVGGGDADEWRRVLEVDLLAPVDLVRALLPGLRAGSGRVLNLSSTAASVAIPGLSAYCVAKAGLRHFTRVLAIEEPSVVTVSVQPGPVDTSMHVALRDDDRGALTDEWNDLYHRMEADGELATPDRPGRSLAWLALHAPGEMSGQEVHHDDNEVIAGATEVFGPL